MNIILDLFLTFAKIGLFTFGWGYAMISMIENNCNNWNSAIITFLLTIIMIGYKKYTKKKLSPILLIVISAIAGIVLYEFTDIFCLEYY